MNKVVIVVVLAAVASILLYAAILALVPRYDYGGLGGGICFHKPQEIVDHVIEPKLVSEFGGEV